MITNRRSLQTPIALRSRYSPVVTPPTGVQPAYIRKAAAASASASTSITATFANPTPLNRLLVGIATSGSTAGSAWVTPSGWSRGPEIAVSGLLGSVIFYKLATASEPLSYTFDTGATSSYKLLTILEFSGNLTSAVFDQSATAADAGSEVTSIGTGTTGALIQADEISIAIAAVSGTATAGGGYKNQYNDAYSFYSDTAGSEIGTYTATYTATYTGQVGSTEPAWGEWSNGYQSLSVQSTGDTTLTTHNVSARIVSATTAQSSTVAWTPAKRAVGAIATFRSLVSTNRSGSVSVGGTGRVTVKGFRSTGQGGTVYVSESGSIQGTGMAVSSTIVQSSPIASTNQNLTVRATWTSTTVPGDLLLAFLVATPNSGFTAPAGWIPLTQTTRTGLGGQIFYIPNAPSRSGDETFTLGAVSDANLMLMEARGIVSVGPLDVQATASGLSNLAFTGQTAQTAQDDELWVGLIGAAGTTTFNNETNGFNLFKSATGPRISMVVLDAPVAANGLASSNVTLQSSLSWVGAVVAFKARSLDLGGTLSGFRAQATMGGRATGTIKTLARYRADGVVSARFGARTVQPPGGGSPPVIPPPDAFDVVRKETEELAILLTEPRISYDFDGVRNVVEVLGAKPEAGLKRVRAVATAPRNHPLSPQNLARNGEPRYLIEVIETGMAVHRKEYPARFSNRPQLWGTIVSWQVLESARIHAAMVKRKKRAQEIADRRLDEFLRLAMNVEADILPQPHLQLGDIVLLKSHTAGRHEFRFKRGSLPLGSSSAMTIGSNKRLRSLKKKRQKKKVGRQHFGWPDPR